MFSPRRPERYSADSWRQFLTGSADGFHDSQGDEELLRQRQQYMSESEDLIMDFSSPDCIISAFIKSAPKTGLSLKETNTCWT
jgi:hypothetical protein